jgi:hypothetical protein
MVSRLIEKIKSHRHYKTGKNFAKYFIVGSIFTLLSIFLMWFFIDIAKFSGLIGSTIATAIIFVGKYYGSVFIGLIKPKFIKYSSTAIVFSLLTIFFMWLMVDILGISAIISSSVVTISLFLLRFLSFYFVGIIKDV